jgi:hypothetical protein
MCVDEIKRDDDGRIWYRLIEKYGTFGDIFWAPAEAFKPISPQEMTAINPDVEDKRVEVDLSHRKPGGRVVHTYRAALYLEKTGLSAHDGWYNRWRL